MDITPLIASDRQVIQSYRNAQFRIANATYQSPVLVQPSLTSAWEAPFHLNEITAQDFLSRLDHHDRPDIILFGSGEKQIFLPESLQNEMKEAYGLRIEVMATDAACRTFNVLLSEDRRVAAFLLPF